MHWTPKRTPKTETLRRTDAGQAIMLPRRHGRLHALRFSVARSLVASRGKRRAGCLWASCPPSLKSWLRPNTLGSCLAFACISFAHAVFTCQFRRVSSARSAALARLHSRPCLHNAPLCAGRRAHALIVYTKPFAEACARRPVRAARRTTRTMQNGRRCIRAPCRCRAPCAASTSYPCASPARRPWLACGGLTAARFKPTATGQPRSMFFH